MDRKQRETPATPAPGAAPGGRRKPKPKPAVAPDPAALDRARRLAVAVAAAAAEFDHLGELPRGPELGRLNAALCLLAVTANAWYHVQMRTKPRRPRLPKGDGMGGW